MLRMKLLFLLAVIFVFSGTNVLACLCSSKGSENQRINKLKKTSDAVFVGTVIHVDRLIKDGSFVYRAVFRVEKTWKGNSLEVEVNTSTDCRVSFEEGKQYLIYAKENESKELQTDVCMRSRPVGSGAVDLRKLGKPKVGYKP